MRSCSALHGSVPRDLWKLCWHGRCCLNARAVCTVFSRSLGLCTPDGKALLIALAPHFPLCPSTRSGRTVLFLYLELISPGRSPRPARGSSPQGLSFFAVTALPMSCSLCRPSAPVVANYISDAVDHLFLFMLLLLESDVCNFFRGNPPRTKADRENAPKRENPTCGTSPLSPS